MKISYRTNNSREDLEINTSEASKKLCQEILDAAENELVVITEVFKLLKQRFTKISVNIDYDIEGVAFIKAERNETSLKQIH